VADHSAGVAGHVGFFIGWQPTMVVDMTSCLEGDRAMEMTMETPQDLRVLLVDDDHDGANSTALLLRHFGVEARTVYDSRLACGEARSFQPDLMLIDLEMPSLDGCAVARELRAIDQFEATPLIVVSGHVDPAHRAACHEAGFDEYLVKPVPLERLLRLVAEVRAAKAASQEARARAESEVAAREGAESGLPRTVTVIRTTRE